MPTTKNRLKHNTKQVEVNYRPITNVTTSNSTDTTVLLHFLGLVDGEVGVGEEVGQGVEEVGQ